MSTMTKARTSARDKLLEAASKLFYANGMTATGIDAITAEAGVASQTLYNNFKSKHELILGYIEIRHKEWMQLYAARLGAATTDVDKVLAVFDAYIDHAELPYPEGFRGCGLLNAAAELPVGADGRELVRKQKREVESILVESLGALCSAEDARPLATQFSLLLEGAMMRAGLEQDPSLLYQARSFATLSLRALG